MSQSLYPVSNEDAKQIYNPTLKFKNIKDIARERKYGFRDEDSFFLIPPHWLEYHQALKVTIYCPFDFTSYPFDSHQCQFNFGASDLTTDYLELEPTWIRYNQSLIKPGNNQGKLEIKQKWIPFKVTLEEIQPFVHFEAGFYYSYAGLKIRLVRTSLGQLMSRFFIPTGIFALTSLISYAIDPNVVPGRLGLLITTWLIASNVHNAVDGPTNRGFSYVEVWMIGMQITIFMAILEYGILLTFKRMKVSIKSMDTSALERCLDKWMFVGSATFLTLFVSIYVCIVTSLDQ